MKIHSFVIVFYLFLTSFSLSSAESEKKIIKFGDNERFYYVITPEKINKEQPLPLVIILHGGGWSALKIMGKLGFTELAKQNKFILVFPNALVKNWNDGREWEKSYRNGKKIDDVGFLKNMIKKIKSNYPVNPDAVFMAGVSNGGMMTFRMACEDSLEFAAVATVIANMAETLYQKFNPLVKSGKSSIFPLPLLMMNGTDDPLVMWDGGSISLGKRDIDRGKVVSVDDTINFWVSVNKCVKKPLESTLSDKDKSDGVMVKKVLYQAKNDNAEVVLYILDGGGHTWPGREMVGGKLRRMLSKKLLGNTCMDIDPAVIIWDFFNKHIKKNSSKVETMCRKYDKKFPDVKHVTVKKFLRNSQKYILVDVRLEKERKVSMIPGAVTKEVLENNIAKYKTKNLLIYCTVGERSSVYAKKLKKREFANVANLRGGVLEWAQNGQLFVTPDGKQTKKVHVYGKTWNLLPEGYEGIF